MLNLFQFGVLLILNLLIIINFDLISKYFNLYDIPNQYRKKQLKPVSLLGGFIFVINFSFFLLFDIYFKLNTFESFFGLNTNIKLYSFIFLFFCIYSIGYADDKFDLQPFTKIVLVTICLYLIIENNQGLVINSIKSTILTREIDLYFIGPYFTIFCILCYMNAMNMFDGVNLVSFLHFFLIGLVLLVDNKIFIFSLVLLFSLLVFGYLNLRNFSFLGDSGVYVLAFISGITLIALYKNNNLNIEEILILIYLPMLDFFRLFFVRIYKGKSPFLPDENHLHHLLMKKLKFKKSLLIIFSLLYFPVILNYLFDVAYSVLILFITIYIVLLYKLKKKTN